MSKEDIEALIDPEKEEEKEERRREKKQKREERRRRSREKAETSSQETAEELKTTGEETGEKSDGKSAEKSEGKTAEKSEGKAAEEAAEETPEVVFDADGNAHEVRRRKTKQRRRRRRQAEEVNIVKELLGLIIYIGIVVLFCYLIITFVGCRSKVDGNSMNPTLNNGDNLWISKISYTVGDPKRFDVIVFNYDENTTYVKRIIGLPGETVLIDELGNIYINGEVLSENYGKERISRNKLGRASQPVLLGSDEYFVLGDNRNNSSDSRYSDVGNIKRKEIVGKAVFRIFPFNAFGFVK